MGPDPGWGYVKAGLVGAVAAAVVMLSLPVVAAVGDAFTLGQGNSANAVTSLQGSAAANLRLTNDREGAPALDLRVTSGAAPLKVDSSVRVAMLNADLLDGKHASGLAAANHGHAGVYLPVGGMAADSSLLDGLDSTAFSLADHSHAASAITSGILGEARFSAYSDLGVEGYLDNSSGTDLLTRIQADRRFVNEGAVAADSNLLDGLDSTAFSLVSHGHDASAITSGTLSYDRFSAAWDLGTEGWLDNNDDADLLARSQADGRYLRPAQADTRYLSSTEDTLLYVPGNTLELADFNNIDVTVIRNRNGVAMLAPGTDGFSTVVLPITLPAQQSGRWIKLVNLRVYYSVSDSADRIDSTELFKLDAAAPSGIPLVSDGTDYNSTTWTSIFESCSSADCALSWPSGGFVTLYLKVYFSGTGLNHWITIGGVLLRYSYD